MNRIVYLRLKKLNVKQKREFLIMCSKEMGFAVPQLLTCSDTEIKEIFDKFLEHCKEV